MTAPILIARDIGKRFGDVVALDGVGIALQPGRIMAVVGENGAGKSTLAKILAGILRPDEGTIEIDGRDRVFRRRSDAIAAGIALVPQSLSFITTLTLTENHIIGRPGLGTDWRGAAKALAAASRELGFDLPLDEKLGRLSLPQRQLGEIASAVAAGARILLLDEPTSALGPLEIDNLIGAIRRLAGSGTAIGLVTHRITEVLNGADDVSVLRGGRPIFDGPTTGITADAIAHFMVGAAVPQSRKGAPPREDVRLAVEAISLRDGHSLLLDKIAFTVRAGEILGIAGIASASQTALADVLVGLRQPDSGHVRIGALDVTGNALGARGYGIAHMPEERAAAIVPDLSVAENASLLRLGERGFSRFGLRRRGAEARHGDHVVQQWNVRPQRYDLPASALSGGNQQKLLIGRELEQAPPIIVAHGPTQGLDIAAAAVMRDRLVDAAGRGAAIVLISADLDEILSISHRVIVLSAGRITDDFVVGDAPVDMIRLGRAIGGQTIPPVAEPPLLPIEAPAKEAVALNAERPTAVLPPLLGQAFPPHGLRADESEALAALQAVLDHEIAPRAAENDARGRYPTESIAALKTSGILASAIPRELGGLGFSHRAAMEAQIRIAAADSAVAQIYKIHEEVVREIVTYIPDEGRPSLVKAVLEERKILGLAVAENGRTVNDPMTTLYAPAADGGAVINGRKIYTTGAAGADIIVVWSFDPTAPGIAENPVLGLRVSLVPASTPGIEIHRDWNALGQRATDSGTITFTDVRIEPSWNGLAPGRLPPLHAPLRWQLGFAAILIGNAIGGIRAAVPFVNERSRPWPSSGAGSATDDPYVRRLTGELVADLAASYALTLSAADLLDAFERGEVDRTAVAIPVYAAKSAASRAAVRATSEIFALMGTRSVVATNGFDRYWRNVRTLSLHDPVDWKHAEIGSHVLTGWAPPWGIYQ